MSDKNQTYPIITNEERDHIIQSIKDETALKKIGIILIFKDKEKEIITKQFFPSDSLFLTLEEAIDETTMRLLIIYDRSGEKDASIVAKIAQYRGISVCLLMEN